MKRVVNSEQQNIIFDTDITMTNPSQIGQSLSEVLSAHDSRINTIESNTKWLYKYGGIGSGGGSGGSSSEFKTIVECVTTPYVISGTNGTLLLSNPGTYEFKAQIYRGGTSTYTVTWTYTSGTTVISKTDTVTADMQFTVNRNLTFDENTNLTIKIVNNDTFDVNTYQVYVIVKSYSFNLGFAYADNPETSFYPDSNGNVYMQDVAEHGLVAVLKYSSNTSLKEASYKYIDWDNKTHIVETTHLDDPEGEYPQEIHQNVTNKSIIIKLIEDDDNYTKIKELLSNGNNAAYKVFQTSIKIILNDDYENINPLILNANLIPSTMYLKVSTDGGSIYKTPQEESGYLKKFSYGAATFSITPYQGANNNRTYSLQIFYGTSPSDAVKLDNKITSLHERVQQNVVIPVDKINQNYVKFIITYETNTFECGYYFWVNPLADTWPWYPIGILPETSCIYRYGIETNNITYSNDIPVSQADELIMTNNDIEKTFKIKSSSVGDISKYDQLFAVGLQYSALNNEDTPIITFSSSDQKNGNIIIYQNKLVIKTNNESGISANDTKKDIFINKEFNYNKNIKDNYHLITIYKKFEGSKGANDYYKSTSVYIDGVLECVTNNFENAAAPNKNYTNITLHAGNYSVNLLEYSCFKHETVIRDDDKSRRYLTENNILGYYYSFYEKILNHEITDDSTAEEKEAERKKHELYAAFENFVSLSDDFIEVKINDIEKIALASDAPVLYINHTNSSPDGSVGKYSGFGIDNFKRWISESYSSENNNIPPQEITIQWANGKNENLTPIKIGNENAYFKISPQGSSTLMYRCKNFELEAPIKDATTEYIYSPNFDENDSNTFLPERSFTLKADVVDSSHSNNNAMGNFINKVTTRFAGSQQTSNRYNSYIKNCLTGFPILVFLHTNFKRNKDDTEISLHNYYFLGIYNFNLGRKSNFNLGYQDLTILTKTTENPDGIELKNGFNLYEIKKEKNVLLNGLRIAEIQGNNKFFDFSQSDDTILYKLPNIQADETYMFGDMIDGSSSSQDNTKADVKQLVESIALAGGYIFDTLEKTYSIDINDKYGYDDGYSAVDNITGISKNQVPNYKYKATRTMIGSDNNYIFSERSDQAIRNNLVSLIIQDEEHRYPLLDYTSVSEYYTICMAFGLVDSVQKNLNIKAWKNNSSKFYTAFYDMDTCLGIANDGHKTGYYAFSDYWKSSFNETTKILNSAVIYRDFSPKSSTTILYDTPSSYLFAIPKYASVLLNEYKSKLSYQPCDIWALWRSTTESALYPGKGSLKNADSFINTYFKQHLKNIPYAAFNYNYKYKYLVYSDDNNVHVGYDTTNYEKFYGRKLFYTKDWLNSRIHILDAYFNLNSVPDVIVSSLDPSKVITAPVPDSNNIDSSNDDIYVLHDVFSNSGIGRQYPAADFYLTVNAVNGSSLFIITSNTKSRYLVEDQTNFKLHFKTDGSQNLTFGGSPTVKNVDTINNFITGEKLYINSQYFTDIIGDGQIVNPTTTEYIKCNTWDLTTPALKNISLTGKNFSGSLKFTNEDSGNYCADLSSINISNTAIKLTVDNSLFRKLTATNLQSGSQLKITNSTYLNDVQINGTCDELEINAWQKNITLPTTSGKNDEFNCPKITIATKYEGAVFKLNNNSTIQTLILKGFESIDISNCPKLEQIILQHDSDSDGKLIYTLKSLNISFTNTSVSFKIGNEDNVIDLSNESKLTYIYIPGNIDSTKLTKIKLPNNDITLGSSAFLNHKNLTSISGFKKLIITGRETFYRCSALSLNNIITATALEVKSSVSDITNTFYNTLINTTQVNTFITSCCNNARNSIKNISGLFNDCPNVTYSLTDMFTDISQKTCCIALNFPFATTANSVFSSVVCFNKYMLQYFGSDASITNININNIFNCQYFNATTDFLEFALGKITEFKLYHSDSPDYCESYITFYDNAATQTDVVEFRKIFNPTNGKTPAKIQSLNYFSIINKVDFTDAFLSSDWVDANINGLILNYVFCAKDQPLKIIFKKTEHIDPVSGTTTYTYSNTFDYIFKNIQLKSLIGCFSNVQFWKQEDVGIEEPEWEWHNVTDSTWVDIGKITNWSNNISKLTSLFSYGTRNYLTCLNFKKYVNYDTDTYDTDGTTILSYSFQHIWDNIISKARSLNTIHYLCNNLYIYDDDHIDTDEFYLNSESFRNNSSNTPNTAIKNIARLFSRMKVTLTDPSKYDIEPGYILLSHDFMHYMNSVTFLEQTFYGLYLTKTIPYDFFNKRSMTVASKWIDDPESTTEPPSRKKVFLISYSYSQTITNMYQCFANITLKNPEGFDPTHEYNKGAVKNQYLANKSDGSEPLENTTYYDNIQTTVQKSIITYTEVTDCNNISTDYVYEIEAFTGGSSIDIETIYNYDLRNTYNSDIKNRLFIAPDILYAVFNDKTSNVDNVFSNFIHTSDNVETDPQHTNVFTGALPKNLLKNLTNIQVKDIFTNLNILPQFFGSYETTEGDEPTELSTTVHNCYTFVPDNFINQINLDNAFNFRIYMPPETPNEFIEGKRIQTHYFILRQDSISKNTVYMSNALPSAGNKYLFVNPQSESDSIQYAYKNHLLEYSLICNPEFNEDGTLKQFENAKLGLDIINYFKRLTLDGLFATTTLRLLSQRLFTLDSGHGMQNYQQSRMKDPKGESYIMNLSHSDQMSKAITEYFPDTNIRYIWADSAAIVNRTTTGRAKSEVSSWNKIQIIGD